MRWRVRLITVSAVLSAAAALRAEDKPRFVERTPAPRLPAPACVQTTAPPVAPWAISGVSRYQAGGYVGGGKGSCLAMFHRGSCTAPGAVGTGTFGWDFAGFRSRPGRVFLGAAADPPRGSPFAAGYAAQGRHVPDVFAIRPLRTAVLEKKEAAAERHGEGHEK